MGLQINHRAVQHARNLIKGRQYVTNTDWSEAQPSTELQNEYIQQYGYQAYGDWHLVVNGDEPADTKKRYEFPFGDFEQVHRSGLIAIKQRAAHEGYQHIEDVADDLLQAMPEAA